MRCKRIVITGTSAVRDAANQQELVRAVHSRFGLHLQVLSGDEEARLTYLGAVSNKELQGQAILMDIGGGSTEFILGQGSEIRQAVSLDIGSVRLTERFIKHDPVTDEEFQNLVSGIRNEFENITCLQVSGLQNFIGVAGTITTLAAMQLKMTQYQADLIDNCLLTVTQIDDLVGQLRIRTVVEKKQLPGLNPKRADVILTGAVILREAMDFFGFEQVLVSDRGLRYGVAIKALTDTDLSA
jgi:exopolyphosphatase/guanosine-5'-triphosphate,3'-diphosphate pyrophosphatase